MVKSWSQTEKREKKKKDLVRAGTPILFNFYFEFSRITRSHSQSAKLWSRKKEAFGTEFDALLRVQQVIFSESTASRTRSSSSVLTAAEKITPEKLFVLTQ